MICSIYFQIILWEGRQAGHRWKYFGHELRIIGSDDDYGIVLSRLVCAWNMINGLKVTMFTLRAGMWKHGSDPCCCWQWQVLSEIEHHTGQGHVHSLIVEKAIKCNSWIWPSLQSAGPLYDIRWWRAWKQKVRQKHLSQVTAPPATSGIKCENWVSLSWLLLEPCKLLSRES
jgi:hypothetical protein